MDEIEIRTYTTYILKKIYAQNTENILDISSATHPYSVNFSFFFVLLLLFFSYINLIT